MAKNKRQIIAGIEKDIEKLKPSYTVNEMLIGTNTKNWSLLSNKVNLHILYNSVFTL